MTLMVASLTTLLRMCTRELLQVCRRAAVTVSTSLTQTFLGRHLERRMRVAMTFETGRLLGSMRKVMTLTALGHQVVIVVLAWIVSVKLLVAVQAGKAMLTAITLQIGILHDMTLTALNRRQWYRVGCVKVNRKNKHWQGQNPCQCTDQDQTNIFIEHVASTSYLAGQLFRS